MARHKLTEAFPDDYIRETLARVDGVSYAPQRLDQAFFHPFPARMPLSIAEFLIDRLTFPSAMILDPMAGSGTTLIAAKKLRRNGLGFDLDPLAVALARSNTLTLDRHVLREAHDRVYSRAVEQLKMSNRQAVWFSKENKAFIDIWFPVRSQKELQVLAAAIQNEPVSLVRDFLWTVFSSLIIAKSVGASYARDLARSRPHRDLKKQILWPLHAWPSRFERALKRLKFPFGNEPCGKAEVRLGDARHLDVMTSTVDLVLTSPPYLSASRACRPAIDYMRTHKFSLVWMGHNLTTLRQLRTTMIGTEYGRSNSNGIAEPIEEVLNQFVPWHTARGRMRRYLSDLHVVLVETRRVLKPGALAVFIVGPSIMSQSRYDAVEIISDIARSIGMNVVDGVVRKLDARRRSLPPPWHLPGENSLNKRIRSEVVMVLRKPQ